MKDKNDIYSLIEKDRDIKVPDINYEIDNTKGIKRFIKKVIYKPVSWIFQPILDYLQDKNDVNANVLQQLKSMEASINKLTEELKENERKLGSIARDTIRTKWRFMDYTLPLTDISDREIQCGICKYKNEVKTFKTLETDCKFEGGHLIRYVCPECGVIFGPLKFSDQTEQELDDDYIVHYTGFNEGDSTDKEIAAFMQLKPEKGKTYLNYGCGSWSNSIKELQDEGYIIYGYDPYPGDSTGNPFIIKKREELRKMWFDGLFSNDLLEHLPDPAKELAFMKSLLNHPSAKMAHSTSCYKYMYEYTRFHMYFFTGRSLDVITENAGLTHGELIADEKLEDFLCYIFSMKENTINYFPHMYINFQAVEPIDGKIFIRPGDIFCGPYIQLPKSEYKLRMNIEIPDDVSEIMLTVTANCGRVVIFETKLKDGENIIDLTLTETYKELEFVIRNEMLDKNIVVSEMEIL